MGEGTERSTVLTKGVFSLDEWHIEGAAHDLVVGGDPRNNENHSDLTQGQLR